MDPFSDSDTEWLAGICLANYRSKSARAVSEAACQPASAAAAADAADTAEPVATPAPALLGPASTDAAETLTRHADPFVQPPDKPTLEWMIELLDVPAPSSSSSSGVADPKAWPDKAEPQSTVEASQPAASLPSHSEPVMEEPPPSSLEVLQHLLEEAAREEEEVKASKRACHLRVAAEQQPPTGQMSRPSGVTFHFAMKNASTASEQIVLDGCHERLNRCAYFFIKSKIEGTVQPKP